MALVQKQAGGKLALGTRDVDGLLGFFGRYNEQTDRAKLADFRAMVVSVNEEEASRRSAQAHAARGNR